VVFSGTGNGHGDLTIPVSTDVLQCSLTSGVYKWSILVEEMTGSVSLGVASTAHELSYNDFLGHQAGGWAYRDDGSAVHDWSATTAGHPKFKTGSKVTLILDLTGEGTLSVSVDGKPAAQLHSNLLSKPTGFVPAVSIDRTGAVRFLGFE
jgi:hypothetical protein